MLSFKLPMRKYFTLLYVTFSVMSFAQFQDNVFDNNNKSTVNQQSTAEADQSASLGVPAPGEHEEGPGNPGAPTVPIDDYLPMLIIIGLSLIIFYEKRLRKINI